MPRTAPLVDGGPRVSTVVEFEIGPEPTAPAPPRSNRSSRILLALVLALGGVTVCAALLALGGSGDPTLQPTVPAATPATACARLAVPAAEVACREQLSHHPAPRDPARTPDLP